MSVQHKRSPVLFRHQFFFSLSLFCSFIRLFVRQPEKKKWFLFALGISNLIWLNKKWDTQLLVLTWAQRKSRHVAHSNRIIYTSTGFFFGCERKKENHSKADGAQQREWKLRVEKRRNGKLTSFISQSHLTSILSQQKPN